MTQAAQPPLHYFLDSPLVLPIGLFSLLHQRIANVQYMPQALACCSLGQMQKVVIQTWQIVKRIIEAL